MMAPIDVPPPERMARMADLQRRSVEHARDVRCQDLDLGPVLRDEVVSPALARELERLLTLAQFAAHDLHQVALGQLCATLLDLEVLGGGDHATQHAHAHRVPRAHGLGEVSRQLLLGQRHRSST